MESRQPQSQLKVSSPPSRRDWVGKANQPDLPKVEEVIGLRWCNNMYQLCTQTLSPLISKHFTNLDKELLPTQISPEALFPYNIFY